MSMLSAQCDKLRETAGLVEDHGRFVGFGGSISTDPLMVDAAKEMRDAADTIWQLRNDCVELRHDLEDANNQAEEVCIENEKLRELVMMAYKAARMMCEAWDGPCQSNSDVPSWRVSCPADERDEQCVFGQLERNMRDLGVEVDDG